jgi:pantothenate kinase
MAVTVDMGMDMVVVIINSMDLVTMVITKRLFLPSVDALKIVQEHLLLQSGSGTSIHLLTHSHNKTRLEFSE